MKRIRVVLKRIGDGARTQLSIELVLCVGPLLAMPVVLCRMDGWSQQIRNASRLSRMSRRPRLLSGVRLHDPQLDESTRRTRHGLIPSRGSRVLGKQ